MKKQLILTALAAGTISLPAAEFFQASLTPDVAIHSRSTKISGLALSIWGENPQEALAIGFVNGSTGDSSGLSWGLVNYADSYTGVAWGIVNASKGQFVGWQCGFVNFSQGSFVGLQSGGINVAKSYEGLQLGFVNYSESLRGVQLGFINVAMNNPWFTELPDKFATGFPFINWSF